MTVSLDQADALLKEYADLIKTQQGEIIEMKRQIQQLKFELSSVLNKEYDV
jgi:uncharacterized protein YdcH (DUF465 family)